MKERFEGPEGQRRLIAELCRQSIVAGDLNVATAIASEIELIEVEPNTVLIKEDGAEDDIYFILVGSFTVFVKGAVVGKRKVGNHVGDMSAIDPSLPRSATIVANEVGVVGKVSEPVLTKIAELYPSVWRQLAKELANRLRQRNVLIRLPNTKPRIFVISSKEALHIAQEIQSILAHEYDVVVWTNGVFFASSYPLEALEREVDASDFAIAIAQPDDRTKTRGKNHSVPRDNVIFELGMFLGRLGRRRAILFHPTGRELKLPTDLTGITPIAYPEGLVSDLPRLLAPSCHEVRRVVNELGVRK